MKNTFKNLWGIHHIRGFWYKFSCWGWKRYTTVKPYKLDHGWIERSDLLPHVIFQCLVDFVENSIIPQGYDKLYTEEEIKDAPEYNKWMLEEHNKFTKEMLFLYNWWKEWHEEKDYEEWEKLGEPDYPDPNNLVTLQNKHQMELDEMCIRVIKIRRLMWT